MDRYHRQILLPQIGSAGQARLAEARVLLVGCGALGTVIAEQLVRAGVGTLRIVDRDFVELTNLQRQVLFDERDAREQTPKAIAAACRLRSINSSISIESLALDFHAGNAEEIAGMEAGGSPVDLILDGTDSVETRYLLNDLSVKHGIPWIYGACVGTIGRMMAVRPPATACLRCVFPTPPAPGELPTCDTAGVFAPVAAIVASLQASAALKLLLGDEASAGEALFSIDLWNNRIRSTPLAGARRVECIACGQRRFEFLDCRSENNSTSLCGRNAVQVRPAVGRSAPDLALLAEKLSRVGEVERTPYLVRCQLAPAGDLRLTVFPDGRLIVQGTSDPDRAKSIYARYVGA